MLKNLLEKNHRVFPVNPKAEEILSIQSYRNI
ncbi:MAG: CoA-binding protein [Patescibacteria group bacterium]